MNKQTIINVRASNTGSQNLLIVSSDISNQYQLKNNLKLSFGSYSARFKLSVNPNLANKTMIVPVSALVPKSTHLHMWSTGNNSYRLGPVIAILTSQSGNGSKPFAGRPKFFAQLINHAQKFGVYMYVVTPNGINPISKVFTGFTYKHKKWYKVSTPLPDVVYNRVPSRLYEQQKKVRWAKSYILTQNIPFFNRHFLNKSELHKIFSKTHSADLIPKTLKWAGDKKSLAEAINAYGMVYLKPVHSFAGHGIQKINRSKNGYIVQSRDEKKNKPHIFKSYDDMWSMLKRRKKRAMIIQQGVDLAEYNNNIFDVRALSQRDSSGEWQLMGMGCRVAGEGRITTHVPNGGRIAPIDKVLNQTFMQQDEMINRSITKITTEVPALIEQYYGYSFGIMSMDIGIDKSGRLWLFEANSKPMEFDEEDTQNKSMQTLFEYSKYLTNKR